MKKVLLKLSDESHAKLKSVASGKGMKFYSYLEQELEKVAKREERKPKQG